MARIIISALLVLLFALPVPVMAAAAETGVIEGEVVNETNGGAGVPNQEFTLKTYINDSETSSKTVKTDARGQFVVEGLTTKSGYSYDVLVNYQGADYNSEKVSFGSSDTRKSVKVIVYDSTTEDKAIKVESAHTIIYAEQGNLLVKSYSLFGNDANLTYIGSKQLAPDKKETLKFFLPAGATEMEYGLDLMECCIIIGGEVLSDTMAVLPGSKEIAYTYKLPYKADAYTFTQKFDYSTGRFDLLVQQGDGISVSASNLVQEQPVSIEGKNFNRYSLQDISAGDVLDVQLSGLPKGSGSSVVRVLTFGLVALALAGGVGYVVTKRKTPQPVPVRAENTSAGDKRRLLAELARLDDDFDAGRIGEDAYNRQRMAKKAQLLRLMRSGGEGETPARRKPRR
ncbi:MAG: hypothetical protein HY665_06670 [Chloroflexi bacterium]|nr:hypothetical protein [Chloroflexota bacterium]